MWRRSKIEVRMIFEPNNAWDACYRRDLGGIISEYYCAGIGCIYYRQEAGGICGSKHR